MLRIPSLSHPPGARRGLTDSSGISITCQKIVNTCSSIAISPPHAQQRMGSRICPPRPLRRCIHLSERNLLSGLACSMFQCMLGKPGSRLGRCSS